MRPATTKLGAGVAAVLLPPLGVFLDRGLGRDFWIAAGLTCLAWAPGVAFALWTVLAR
ncbi:YqaE/Pmp3 family membrane protein [Sphingomonas sp. MAH-20]|jgi:uncharacterized membrane protein YqaE (UPF0057 family)|uniref:YqaE/Pmp3 family membrane protein n=1 Tax=Sphingomonas horti TaxID=2682842 RepID=A0A6I4J0P3_9SPHN|nr:MULTISPECIES: YqaE/Pmp3 family membrane protein [Sphingomonas]MBA2920707.1 YqaE/Pmp3 family membrane protein [Sphingomonas sp. CGMCC 1.13658]MVO77643.1 YqaE/Pmp3 family membrane protein [Sphingomonas horti]